MLTTKAKDVNFYYCNTNQRLASFMDFNQQKKKKNLKFEASLKQVKIYTEINKIYQNINQNIIFKNNI